MFAQALPSKSTRHSIRKNKQTKNVAENTQRKSGTEKCFAVSTVLCWGKNIRYGWNLWWANQKKKQKKEEIIPKKRFFAMRWEEWQLRLPHHSFYLHWRIRVHTIHYSACHSHAHNRQWHSHSGLIYFRSRHSEWNTTYPYLTDKLQIFSVFDGVGAAVFLSLLVQIK